MGLKPAVLDRPLAIDASDLKKCSLMSGNTQAIHVTCSRQTSMQRRDINEMLIDEAIQVL